MAGRLLAPAPGWIARADIVVVGSGVAAFHSTENSQETPAMAAGFENRL